MRLHRLLADRGYEDVGVHPYRQRLEAERGARISDEAVELTPVEEVEVGDVRVALVDRERDLPELGVPCVRQEDVVKEFWPAVDEGEGEEVGVVAEINAFREEI